MEAEARELARILRVQITSGVLLVNGTIHHALGELERAVATKDVEDAAPDFERDKAFTRELARLRRLDDGAILIEPTTAHLAAYGSEPGTL